MRVRLSEIDAPELSQPYGAEASAALQALLGDRRARIVVVDIDRYGRNVADVYQGDRSINVEMVRLGHAWAYTRYAKTLDIIDREQEAREAGRGLWRLPESDREPPWVWRAEKRRASRRKKGSSSGDAASRQSDEKVDPAEIVCGVKRTCGEMTSCAEARAHLEKCGLTRLDGDSDGTPCESLCTSR
jgi:hypothetical protein